MKKFISVIAIMLMLALTACSNKETPPTTDNSSNTQSDSVTMLEEGVCTTPKSRLTGQTPSVWKIFSVHRARHLSKADGNTAGKNTTA